MGEVSEGLPKEQETRMTKKPKQGDWAVQLGSVLCTSRPVRLAAVLGRITRVDKGGQNKRTIEGGVADEW